MALEKQDQNEFAQAIITIGEDTSAPVRWTGGEPKRIPPDHGPKAFVAGGNEANSRARRETDPSVARERPNSLLLCCSEDFARPNRKGATATPSSHSFIKIIRARTARAGSVHASNKKRLHPCTPFCSIRTKCTPGPHLFKGMVCVALPENALPSRLGKSILPAQSKTEIVVRPALSNHSRRPGRFRQGVPTVCAAFGLITRASQRLWPA